jgi:hypothetical protein
MSEGFTLQICKYAKHLKFDLPHDTLGWNAVLDQSDKISGEA